METFVLKRTKWKPGNVAQRFGDWRKGEPCVIVDNARWLRYGSPESVRIEFETETTREAPATDREPDST